MRNLLVVGSSVAAGAAAPPGRGWADLLGAALAERHGYRVFHAAVGGANTATCRARAETVGVADACAPDAVIIALGLANEGLPRADGARAAEEVADGFLSGLAAVAEACRRRWGPVSVIFGGVYPFGRTEGGPGLDDAQRAALERVDREMRKWPRPVLPFLDVGDARTRRWRAGTAADVGHPNDAGHRLMFEAVDLAVFAPDRIPRLERGHRARARAPADADLWAFYGLAPLPP